MNRDIFIVAEHLKGSLSGITLEMLTKAREIADAAQGKVTVLLFGIGVRSFIDQMGAADNIIMVESQHLADFNPEAHQLVVHELLRDRRPWLTFIGLTSMGIDLAATLSAKLSIPLVTNCRGLAFEDSTLLVTSQLYGGKMMVESKVEKDNAIISVLPGAFRAEAGSAEAPPVEDYFVKCSLMNLRTKFEKLIEPEAGDVDITQSPVIISIGRGIQSQDNVSVAEELAEVLGGAVASSRPVVDQGWLPMTRQVGRSGMIVKPKLYLALGISGAPEHVEGMRDSELIIAVNTDPNAPIFQVAHYGICADLFDVVTPLIDEIKAHQGAG